MLELLWVANQVKVYVATTEGRKMCQSAPCWEVEKEERVIHCKLVLLKVNTKALLPGALSPAASLGGYHCISVPAAEEKEVSHDSQILQQASWYFLKR